MKAKQARVGTTPTRLSKVYWLVTWITSGNIVASSAKDSYADANAMMVRLKKTRARAVEVSGPLYKSWDAT